MAIENYLMRKKVEAWREKDEKTIIFIVTEDCNLVCKYCYITGKNNKNKMSFDTAKKAVDYILAHPEEFPEGSVVWQFVGGEPFLAIELIDQITDHIKAEMIRLNHKWSNKSRISISTNGVLYHTSEVQGYIKNNLKNLSIGISVDGNKIKHDMQRIKPDGSGSYDEVAKNIPLWLEQFPNGSTKATFASEDLPYLKDSVISLYELGIKTIPANVIFEDDWKEGDDLIFEDQLKQLADYIIDNRLWDEFKCSLFSDKIGIPLNEVSLKTNCCGVGQILSIDYEGNFYPCTRFVGFSLNNREGYVVGNIENGYDPDKLRPFLALNLEKQSTEECLNCQVAMGCAWCQGFNYDDAKINTVYERATYICKMHKARVRANDYYWAKIKRVAGLERKVAGFRKDHLYIILSDKSTRYCTYSPSDSKGKMDLMTLKQGLEYAKYNFFTPVLLLPSEGLTQEQKELIKDMEVIQIYSGTNQIDDIKESIVVYDNEVGEMKDSDVAIMIVKADQLTGLAKKIFSLFSKHVRINLMVEGVETITNGQLKIYESELEEVAEYMAGKMQLGGYLELNVLSDQLNLEKMSNCNAGIDSFALAPDGKLYLCPAFYYDDTGESVGSLQDGINFNYQEFLTLEKSPVCSQCDAYHCHRCVYLNRKQTLEYLIPGKTQCVTSHVERKVGRKYIEMLAKKDVLKRLTTKTVDEIYPEIDYYDPFEKILINS